MRQPTTEEGQIYFITTVTYERRRSFVRVEQAKTMGGIIVNACRMKGFVLLAYSIMPDHVHVLVQKNSSSGSLEKAPFRAMENNYHLKQGLSSPRVSSALEKAPLRKRIDFVKEHDINNHLKGGLSSPGRRIFTLSDLMQSIKGNFSYRMDGGTFWQEHYDARIVSTVDHLSNTMEYIINNHRKHDLPDAFGRHPFVYHDLRKIRALMY